MNTATLRAIRAIGAEQIRRLVKLIVIIASLVLGAVVAVTGWLAGAYTEWWWVVMVPVIFFATLLVIALAVAWAVAYLLTPRQLTRDERKQVRGFTDRLLVAAASAQISRSALVLLLIKDAFQGKRLDERIRSVIEEGRGLKTDFENIKRLF